MSTSVAYGDPMTSNQAVTPTPTNSTPTESSEDYPTGMLASPSRTQL